MAGTPKPGPRVNGGRPLGSVAAKYQLTAKQIGYSDYYPLEYMLALMRDEQAEPQRRDAMAIQAAPYCHAKLNAVATTNASGKGASGDINLVQIFSVPRGAALDLKSGAVSIEGKDSVELSEVQPYQGTPALKGSDTTDGAPQPVSVPFGEPLPVVEIDTANITRLDTYRDKPE